MTYLSHQDGENTGKTSRTLAMLFIGENQDQIEIVNMWLRKIAHVFVFFVLTILVIVTMKVNQNAYYIYAIIFICLWAFVDEATKLKIQGRHFSLFDVGLNLIGVIMGLLVIYFFS